MRTEEYAQGESAAKRGRPDTDCPYGKSEIARRCQWMGGYWDFKSWGKAQPKRKEWTPKEIGVLYEWYGIKSPQEVADILGRTKRSVTIAASKHGLSAGPAGRKPPSDEKMDAVVEAAKSGMSLGQIRKVHHVGWETAKIAFDMAGR